MRRWICGLFLMNTLACLGMAQVPNSRELASSDSIATSTPFPSSMVGLYRDSMAPGVIGRTQLERDPRLRGVFQPVEIRGPKGSRIAFASDGAFGDSVQSPARAGLMVGFVYRIKIENIPGEEGVELFPSVEIIDRLYPPAEREHRFPIPVVLDQEDLQRAIHGDMITRVVYLEDSEIAAPISYADGIERVYDAKATEDALKVADQLGRPVAILRIGSRVPDATGIDLPFLYGCPPWVTIKEVPSQEEWIEKHGWPRFETQGAEEPSRLESSPSDQPLPNRLPPQARRNAAHIGG